jgi:hypothetical protein
MSMGLGRAGAVRAVEYGQVIRHQDAGERVGGSGKRGRATSARLAAGQDPINLDIAPPADQQCPTTSSTSPITAKVSEALMTVDWRYDRIDAVVHLAAITGLFAPVSAHGCSFFFLKKFRTRNFYDTDT